MRILLVLTAVAVLPNVLPAQTLRLTNSGNDTIIMKYLPRSDRPKKMKEVEIPTDDVRRVTDVRLFGQDPYDVSFYLKPKQTEQGKTQVFHAKAAQSIPLRSLAGTGTFNVQLAIAASRSSEGLIYQATSATLVNDSKRVKVFASPSKPFTKQIVERRWDTIFKAGNGNVVGATLNFENLTFRTNNFTGRFTDVAIFEDNQGCYIVGRWAALGSSGDVFFTIDRASPDVLKGEYTFDGKEQRYFWKSR